MRSVFFQKVLLSIVPVALLIVATGGCTTYQSEADAIELRKMGVVGRTYYLKHSTYYYARRHLTLNYHVNALIPINTPVRVVALSSDQIRLLNLNNGRHFTIINTIIYSRQPLGIIFERMLSEEPVSLAGLTPEEQEYVKRGKIKTGMSKRAVVMAYGYPPRFRTPSLQKDVWKYWISRLSSVQVHFENGVVSKIE